MKSSTLKKSFAEMFVKPGTCITTSYADICGEAVVDDTCALGVRVTHNGRGLLVPWDEVEIRLTPEGEILMDESVNPAEPQAPAEAPADTRRAMFTIEPGTWLQHMIEGHNIGCTVKSVATDGCWVRDDDGSDSAYPGDDRFIGLADLYVMLDEAEPVFSGDVADHEPQRSRALLLTEARSN